MLLRSLAVRLLLAILFLLVIAACAVGQAGGPVATAGPTVTLIPSPVPVTPTASPMPTETPIPRSAILAQELATVQPRPYDLQTWFTSVNSSTGTPFPTFEPITSRRYSVGSTQRFKVNGRYISARLAYQNSVVSMWVQQGLPISSSDIAKAANTFAEKIYPTDRQYFGEEMNPGIDGDPRINVLTAFSLGPNVAGYFSPSDEHPANIDVFSNQQEIFYMSWYYMDVGSEDYMSTLAHEFQHMIQWNVDRNEDIWVNEGLSQVAQRVNEYNTAFTHYNYLFDSQVQLNSWSADFRQSYSNYGAGYLFLQYLDERFGHDLISQISRSPLNGMASIDEALAAYGTTSDEQFANWIVANYVNDPAVEEGRYGYANEKLIPVCPRRRLAEYVSQPPRNTLKQYSANYIELDGEGEFTIKFQGDTEASLIPTKPRSGNWFFWANDADNSTMTLTQRFDLGGLQKARLQYATWYDISDWDMAVVEVSLDEGQHWDLLEATGMKREEETGFSLPHYIGGSGGSSENPIWSQETIDLSSYAGKKVLIRFEYDTSIKSTGKGWVIDDVRIPELNYEAGFEEGDDGWQADGWARIDNKIPQKWALWLVQYNGSTTVSRVELDAVNAAETSVTLPPDGKATIIVGAMAPWTMVPADYSLQVGGSGKMASLKPPPGIEFQESFDNACTSFDSFILPPFYRYGYQDGHYEMELQVEEAAISTQAHQKLFDTVLDVDVTQGKVTKDSMIGVFCRHQDPKNYYLFGIRNDGKFQIGIVSRGVYSALAKPEESKDIKTGEGALNHIQLVCNGSKLTLNVNGVFMKTVEDTTFRGGDIGFTLVTNKFEGTDEQKRKTSILAVFDNLVVRRAE